MPSLSAKNLGFIFHSTRSFSKQISSLSSTCYYHIHDLHRIWDTLNSTTATTIATALVHSRAVIRTPKHSHISPVLKFLHWLNLEQRIQHKIISITHNILHITKPKYLHRLINIKPPSRTRSSYHLCLFLPLFPSGSSLSMDHSATPLPAYGTLYQ